MAHAIRYALLLLLAVFVAGCATTAALRSGERAELGQQYDLAVVEYTKALQSDPDNTAARQGLERSKLRAAQDHFTRGRRFQAAGRLDEALVELQIAAELNPGALNIDEELRAVRAQLRTRIAVTREGKTELETLIERSRTLQPE